MKSKSITVSIIFNSLLLLMDSSGPSSSSAMNEAWSHQDPRPSETNDAPLLEHMRRFLEKKDFPDEPRIEKHSQKKSPLKDSTFKTGPTLTDALNEGSQQYNPHPSQVVPISNFVSIKLSGETDYLLWKEQMMCLLEYLDMVGFIDGTIGNPRTIETPGSNRNTRYQEKKEEEKYSEWKKSDTLVKGWIYATISKDVISTVLGLDEAYKVWEKLKHTYDQSIKVAGAELNTEKDITSKAVDQVADRANYVPLHRAIVRGEWDKAQEFFKKDKATLTAKIDSYGDSALHVAVGTCQNLPFVEKLLKEINIINPTSLPTLVNHKGHTTLRRAAVVGNTDAAKMLVKINPCLLFIANDDADLPVISALVNYHEKTFRYLLEVSKKHIALISQNDGYQNPFEGKRGSSLLGLVIRHGYMDIASELICKYPKLAISSEVMTHTPLLYIVQNQDLYFSATRYNFYQRFIYSHVPIGISDHDNIIPDIENPETNSTKFVTKCKRCYFYPVMKRIYDTVWKSALLHVPHIKHLREDKLKHKRALMILESICKEIDTIVNPAEFSNQYCGAFNWAVLKDNPEAVEMIIRFYPNAMWIQNNGYSLAKTVAKYRCEMLLNFLEDMVHRGNNLFMEPNDEEDNNILHMAGRLAPIEKLEMVSGAFLQMQREVQWYKKIEKRMLPSEKEEQNLKGQTPIMVFREEHKQQRKEGEEWMKKTSDSYTITAALITTIVFAAAITVPGGNDQNTGKPMYKTQASFIIFAISDAISLFTSTTSLLLFLSILTARYHEDDFLYKLPKRLILGLVMLFLSVTSMMVAFGATLYIMFGQGKEWMLIPIAALACLPIASYVILQYPLLHELVSSTYGHGIYIKKK